MEPPPRHIVITFNPMQVERPWSRLLSPHPPAPPELAPRSAWDLHGARTLESDPGRSSCDEDRHAAPECVGRDPRLVRPVWRLPVPTIAVSMRSGRWAGRPVTSKKVTATHDTLCNVN